MVPRGHSRARGKAVRWNHEDAPAGDANEWNALFGDEVLESKFQDGHYVYSVIAGGGTAGVPSGRSSAAGANTGGGTGCGGYPSGGGGTGGPGIIVIKI